MSVSSLQGWTASAWCILRGLPRSPAAGVGMAGAVAVLLASRMGAHGAPAPAALIPAAATADVGAHAAASLLGLLGPVAALTVVLATEQTLLQRRRALLAAFAARTVSRTTEGALSAVVLAAAAVVLAGSYPAAFNILVSPLSALLWILPACMAVAGLGALVSEAVREPLAGFLAGLAWLFVSYVVENVPAFRPSHPIAFVTLTPATVYPREVSLWHSGALTTGAAVVLWLFAAVVAGRFRARGWDT